MQRRAQGPHTPHDLADTALLQLPAHGTVQVGVYRIGGARPHVGAGDRIHGQCCLETGMVEVLVHHVVDIDQREAHQVLHVGLAHHLEPKPELHEGYPVAPVSFHQFRGPAAVELEHEFGKHINLLAERLVCRLVLGTDASTPQQIAVDGQMIAIGLQGNGPFRGTHLQAGFVQTQIPDHGVIELL